MNPVIEIYAFLSIDKDGREGIPAISGKRADGQIDTVPLVGTDLEYMELMKRYVQDRVNETGELVRFVKFTFSEQLAVIRPK